MHVKEGLLRSYLSNGLSGEERNGIADHLSACARCSSRLKSIEERVQFVEPLLPGNVGDFEYSDTQLAIAWQRLKHRINMEDWQCNEAPDTVWHRWPRWVLIAILIIAVAVALLAMPQVRNAIRLVLDALRPRSLTEGQSPSPNSELTKRTPGKPGSRLAPQTSAPPGGQGPTMHSSSIPGNSIQVPSRVSPPEYLPKNDTSLLKFKSGFSLGTGYQIKGKVSTEEGTPLSGAVVSLYSSRYSSRDFKLPTPISTEISNDQGQYSISLESPNPIYLTLSMEGYAQLYDEFELPGSGILTKDYRLRPAVCAEGFVFSKDRKPIEGARVDVWAREANFVSSLPMFIPLISVTGPSGEYSLHGIPEGGVLVGATANEHMPSQTTQFLRHGDCTRIDLLLSAARSFTLTVKTPSGEVLPEAVATTEKGRLNWLSDERGVITCTVEPDTEPFDCWVYSKGYRVAHSHLDPKNPPSVIVLENGKMFNGRVLADSGEPIANATVRLRAANNKIPHFEVGQTDKSGRFSISSDYPLGTISVDKVGYQPQQFTFSQDRPATQEIEVRLKDLDGGGIFGKAFDSSGKPSDRFTVVLIDPSAIPLGTRYARDFQNDRGVFYLDDAPIGLYDLQIWSLPFSQTERGAFIKLGKVEIRKGLVYGEIRVQFPPPKTIR